MGVLSPDCSVFHVTTFYDIPSDLLNDALSELLASNDAISLPEWATYVKTGMHNENPPLASDWWERRCASLLRKIAKKGPIGVNHLSQEYGGKMRRRSTPGKPVAASRKVIRVALQQLEDAGFVSRSEKKSVESVDGEQMLYSGRICTPAGQKILNEAAFSAKELAVSKHPGLEQY